MRWCFLIRSAIVLLFIGLTSACDRSQPAASTAAVFDTPDAAVAELAVLLEEHRDADIEHVFGPGSLDMFRSGDTEADRQDARRVVAMIEESVVFEQDGENTLVIFLGNEEWPWPIPLQREGEGWRFNTEAGEDELLNRRIGRNELLTLTTLHEIVEAQKEYRTRGRDGQPPAYARHFVSSDGQQDGLYWPADEFEEQSPLGHLLAESAKRTGEPQPFNGYYYRMLHSRGPGAPGGEMSYLNDDGLLTHGFGVLAWPAKYGNSGVMTFMTSHRGLVFQQDFGADASRVVQAIDSYDPGDGWMPTAGLPATESAEP